MRFYIREWNDQTIVLMTDAGHVLSYFASIADALNVCDEWYRSNKNETRYEIMLQYKQADSSYSSIPLVA